jgi:hypothetical protein
MRVLARFRACDPRGFLGGTPQLGTECVDARRKIWFRRNDHRHNEDLRFAITFINSPDLETANKALVDS